MCNVSNVFEFSDVFDGLRASNLPYFMTHRGFKMLVVFRRRMFENGAPSHGVPVDSRRTAWVVQRDDQRAPPSAAVAAKVNDGCLALCGAHNFGLPKRLKLRAWLLAPTAAASCVCCCLWYTVHRPFGVHSARTEFDDEPSVAPDVTVSLLG